MAGILLSNSMLMEEFRSEEEISCIGQLFPLLNVFLRKMMISGTTFALNVARQVVRRTQ